MNLLQKPRETEIMCSTVDADDIVNKGRHIGILY